MNYKKILLGLLTSYVGTSVAFSAPPPGGISASGHVYYVLYSGPEDVVFTGNPSTGVTSLETSHASFTELRPLVDGDSLWIRGISADGAVQFGSSEDTAVFWKNGVIQSVGPVISGADNISSEVGFSSANGSVLAGNVNYEVEGDYRNHVFRWTSAGSVVLPNLAGDYSGNLRGITPDGSTLIGSSYGGGITRAVFWRDGVVTNIHPVAIDGGSDAEHVSDNGAVIGINSYTASYAHRAHRWTQADGSVVLGHLTGGTNSYIRDMSSDGAVIVGEATVDAGNTINHAFRWTESGMQDIHPDEIIAQAQANDSSSADFISRDGTTIFGRAHLGGFSATKAFRWTDGNVIDLGSFGGSRTYVRAITPDGQVAVGQSNDLGGADYGFRWTEAGGLQTVEQWLADAGVTVSDDIRVTSAEQVSADGSVVFGYLENGSFVARSTGLITIADLQQSIAQTTAAVSSLRNSASLVLNGAHGHPLSRRTDEGRFIAWAGGDYGSDDHGERDGRLSVAEVGGGYNFGPAQLNLAIGRSDSAQDTVFDGDVEHDGIFLISDVIVPVQSTPLIVTLTAIYQRGDLDTRRGYLNAGLPDSSKGESDTEVFGGAVRVDWADAFSVGEVSFTPFTKLVITRAKVDGFTETGGGFPAVYKTQRDTIADLHLGADASYRLSDKVRLVATLEGVYRFQDNASSSSVSVPGVTAGFTSLAGEDYKQFWISGGAGAEYDIGNGTLSVTLNSSTESPTSNLWLASSYQYKF